MEKGNEYFIECTESDYPFVRGKLTEMGFREWCSSWDKDNNGVIVLTDLDFFPHANRYALYETLTLEQFKQIHMKKQVIELKGATITLDEGYELLQANGVLTVVEKEKEKKLPESWEELEESWEELDEVNGYYVHPSGCEVFLAYSPNKSTFRTKEQAKASIALAQLTQLVHVWREGWEPDWTCWNTQKYVIQLVRYEIIVKCWTKTRHTILSFDTEKKAQKFLSTFEDLIKTAAPLLWGVNLK